MSVICTTGMIADVVRSIGKEYVSVHCLMGSGSDPHVYRACEGDIHRIAQADLIFYNGLHLEGKMAHLLECSSVYTSAYAITDGIPLCQLRVVDETDVIDPHVWFDVLLWIACVRFIGEQLAKHDSNHRDYFMQATTVYVDQLYAVHAYLLEKVASLPPDKRVLVTAHDAFGYFGARYGFQVVGLQGVSTEAEIGIKDIQDLAAFLVERKISTIFVESSVSARALEAVQYAVQARGFQVRIGDSLFSDSLGAPGTPQDTYIGMIKYTVDTIVNALE